jgi:hypothetical protein
MKCNAYLSSLSRSHILDLGFFSHPLLSQPHFPSLSLIFTLSRTLIFLLSLKSQVIKSNFLLLLQPSSLHSRCHDSVDKLSISLSLSLSLSLCLSLSLIIDLFSILWICVLKLYYVDIFV